MDLYKSMLKKDRKYFSVVDGIVGGEGQGPFCPTSKFSNTIIAGDDLFAVDCVTARYMGLDPNKIKYLNYYIENYKTQTNDSAFSVISGKKYMNNFFDSPSLYADYKVVPQWETIKKI